jgi:hypothetical protein
MIYKSQWWLSHNLHLRWDRGSPLSSSALQLQVNLMYPWLIYFQNVVKECDPLFVNVWTGGNEYTHSMLSLCNMQHMKYSLHKSSASPDVWWEGKTHLLTWFPFLLTLLFMTPCIQNSIHRLCTCHISSICLYTTASVPSASSHPSLTTFTHHPTE